MALTMVRIMQAIADDDYEAFDEDMLLSYGFGYLALVGGINLIIDGQTVRLKFKKEPQKMPLSWFEIDHDSWVTKQGD